MKSRLLLMALLCVLTACTGTRDRTSGTCSVEFLPETSGVNLGAPFPFSVSPDGTTLIFMTGDRLQSTGLTRIDLSSSTQTSIDLVPLLKQAGGHEDQGFRHRTDRTWAGADYVRPLRLGYALRWPAATSEPVVVASSSASEGDCSDCPGPAGRSLHETLLERYATSGAHDQKSVSIDESAPAPRAYFAGKVFSPDDDAGAVYLLEGETRTRILNHRAVFRAHEVTQIRVSPDGKKLAYGLSKTARVFFPVPPSSVEVIIRDVATGSETRCLELNYLQSMMWGPDSRVLYVCGRGAGNQHGIWKATTSPPGSW